MKSYKEYLTEGKDSSSKTKSISELVDAIRSWGEHYDIHTRKFVWEHLNSAKGKELINNILRNPKTYHSDSEFVKLIERK